MKISRATIENFKKFAPPGVELDFKNKATGDVADRYLILGDNASGKTTILQAIALTLSLAQRKIPDIRHFGWTGWAPERYFVHGDPIVELTVEFEDDEIAATQEAARRWWDLVSPTSHESFREPGDSRVVTLRLEGARVRTTGSAREIYQFRGRSYVAASVRNDVKLRALFSRLPGVFWYDQFRNIALSGAREPPEREASDPAPPNEMGVRFETAVERLDRILKIWHRNREQRGPHPERDYLGELEALYRTAFPGRSFAGLETLFDGPTPADDRFVLKDGGRTYTLSEMSAGEQSVFPVLFEFVRQQIHRSVVLIDEIDLNLHPPLAQTLLGLLPRLGEDNQFLFTTHARAVSTLVSPHTIHRLPEGRPCL
ncbi:AAA family ATPase [Sorangium sp. So ce185]|uniref:AAA family ATPase n=1 Tax=Sorangium sp. So ce185 TaxID=3133287 RepID=UPI003F619435